jgi:hypothetical protein
MKRLLRSGGRWLRRVVLALAVLLLLSAIPIVWNETQCVGSLPANPSTYQPILGAEHRRNLVDTYLTYPEWSIVHAYEDFAGVLPAKSESGFGYLDSIRGYWHSLCAISAVASSRGTLSADMRATLYIIGTSFTWEMGIKGAWETTIGRLTEWIRGEQPTPEDVFAQKTAERYAAFLQQTPWYEFPFGETLSAYWRDTPMFQVSAARSLERRFALSAEYGVKAIYAQLIAQAAALAPAALTIRSVIDRFDQGDATGDVKVVERRPDGSAVIETPRYRAFTRIILNLVGRDKAFVEIAGNNEILTTVLSEGELKDLPPSAQQLFHVPLQAKPGWQRHGIVVPVKDLGALARAAKQGNAVFEHAYDY